MDTRTQNKISSTIIFTVPPNPVNKLLLNSTFLMEPNTEGYFIYYLKNINLQKDIFMKLTFFTAKTGKRISFFNSRHPKALGFSIVTTDNYDDSILYFKYRLKENFTYDVLNIPVVTDVHGIKLKQILAKEVRII